MKLHLTKTVRAHLPEELQMQSDSPTIQKMQLVALINNPGVSKKVREHLKNVLRILQREMPGGIFYLSRRVH